jgi:hypothetical protein
MDVSYHECLRRVHAYSLEFLGRQFVCHSREDEIHVSSLKYEHLVKSSHVAF